MKKVLNEVLFGVSPIILAWLTLVSLLNDNYLYAAINGLALWVDLHRFFHPAARKPIGGLMVGFLLGIAVIDIPMGFTALAMGKTSEALVSFMVAGLIGVWLSQSLSLVRVVK